MFSQGFNTQPSGGVKVLFDIVSTLVENGINSKILIPGGNFNPSWFYHNVQIENNANALTPNDYVLLHEETLWVFEQIKSIGCRYGILNQGAHWSLTNYLGYEKTKQIYLQAEDVLVNSYNTGELVNRLFGRSDYKKITLGIDDCFSPDKNKENRICFMPRRNSETAELISQYVKGKYRDWEMFSIEGMSYKDVALILNKSKLFLSFGGPEGFGLPPLEAALSGCKVIGYHGYGGQEYFYEPIFTRIDFMDVAPFLDAVDRFVTLEEKENFYTYCERQRQVLKSIYNVSNFKQDIMSIFKAKT